MRKVLGIGLSLLMIVSILLFVALMAYFNPDSITNIGGFWGMFLDILVVFAICVVMIIPGFVGIKILVDECMPW